MNPLVFFGKNFYENPQDFLDIIQKLTEIIGVTPTESAKLVAYRLQGVAQT